MRTVVGQIDLWEQCRPRSYAAEQASDQCLLFLLYITAIFSTHRQVDSSDYSIPPNYSTVCLIFSKLLEKMYTTTSLYHLLGYKA